MPKPMMMEDDYADAAPMPSGQSDDQSEGRDQKPEDENAQTFVFPKEILQGKDFKPGDEVVMQIVALHEDSVEAKYAPEKGGEEKENAEESAPMAAGSSSMGEGGMSEYE